MAVCAACKKQVHLIDPAMGVCPQCAADLDLDDPLTDEELEEALSRIILTTETAHNLPVTERLDIVTAEVVIGMHLFKDIASSWRDTFGGRSKVMQNGLRDAKNTALQELRAEAHQLGADAVVGVDLDYSEISGGGKSMLFLVASGTAVKLEVKN